METLFFERITVENAAAMLEEHLRSLERQWEILITVHDHKRLLCLPDGRHILPHRNLHRCACCRALQGDEAHRRCLGHCKTGVIRQLAAHPSPQQSVCWCALTEVIVPVFKGNEHVATFFGGTFRLPELKTPWNAPLLTEEFLESYKKLPLWNVKRGQEISLLLQTVSAGILQIADRLFEESLNDSGRIGIMKRFIDRNAARNLKLEELAACVGLSKSRTSHLLKEAFGGSFNSLLNRERIRQAKTYLLQESTLSIQEIAERVGFANEFYFNRVFRKLEGIPPGAYRKRQSGAAKT